MMLRHLAGWRGTSVSATTRPVPGPLVDRAAKDRTGGRMGALSMSISTYASQFGGFSGEAFEIVGERPGPQETRLVETRILRPRNSPVAITYVVKEADGRWRITDVLLDNTISELAVRRSEYRRILKRLGPEGLIGVLNHKANVLVSK